MRIRQLWEKYSKKWTAYVVLIFFVFTVAIHVAHVFGFLGKINETFLSSTLSFAVFFLVFLLLEEFFANDAKIEESAKELNEKHDRTIEKLDDLSAELESMSGISGYFDLAVFEAKWRKLRDSFDSVTLVGEIPIDYAGEVRRICEKDSKDPAAMKDKKFFIYRSLNTASKIEVTELIDLAAQARPGLISLYHMYGFEWGSWAMGRKQRNETEVLLNYANADRGTQVGLHLIGRAAEAFERAVTPHFGQIGLPGVSYRPIELASREQVEFIIEEKVEYQKKIAEMVGQGVPIEGTERICRAMIHLVNNTKKHLDVTHLCVNDGAIDRLEDEVFKEWIQANYDAIGRNVTITRIFIVQRASYKHPVLQRVMNEMRSNKIDVRLCPLDDLREQLMEDFSIYDGKHLVYMDKARSYWAGAAQPLARSTENSEKIGDYQFTFGALDRRAERV